MLNARFAIRLSSLVMLLAYVVSPGHAKEPAPYRMEPGTRATYVLKIEITKSQRTEFIGGVVCFSGEPSTRKAVKMQTWDNLRVANSSDGIRYVPPRSNKMLERHLAVNKFGEPLTNITGQLPMLIGDLEELFFPPLPEKKEKTRAKVQKIYDYGGGDLRFYGSKKVDEKYISPFKWSTTYVGKRGRVLRYVHRRQFATNDNQHQLVLQGPIEIDSATGSLLRQQLTGQCVDQGETANVSIDVKKLSRKEQAKLVPLAANSTP